MDKNLNNMNKYEYKVQGIDYQVEIEEVEGNIAKVSVNGIPFEVEMKQPIKAAPKSSVVKPAPKPQAAPKPQPAKAAAPAAPAADAAPAKGRKVVAPLPGTITEVKVKVGDAVKAGDVVIILEAMKMQNNIEAECDGIITAVPATQGSTVMEGDTLVVIDN